MATWSAEVALVFDTGPRYRFEEKVGAGIGVCWNSPKGPVGVDIAHGFQNPGDAVRLHINTGPDL